MSTPDALYFEALDAFRSARTVAEARATYAASLRAVTAEMAAAGKGERVRIRANDGALRDAWHVYVVEARALTA